MVFCSKILILFCYFSTNSHFVLYFIIFAFYFCENKVEIAQKEVEIRLTKQKKHSCKCLHECNLLLILFSLTNLAALVFLLMLPVAVLLVFLPLLAVAPLVFLPLLAVALLVFLPLLALFVPTL